MPTFDEFYAAMNSHSEIRGSRSFCEPNLSG